MSASTARSSTSLDEEKDLLKKHEDDEDFPDLPVRRRKASFQFGRKSSLAVSLALLLSICFNLYNGYRYHHQACVNNTQRKPFVVAAPSYSEFCVPQDEVEKRKRLSCRLRYIFLIILCIAAGLEYNKLVTFQAKTDWQSENETIADALWDGIDISPITIAVSKTWAAEHGLPESNTFYWDKDKALYHIKGIHGMHCLVCPTCHRF